MTQGVRVLDPVADSVNLLKHVPTSLRQLVRSSLPAVSAARLTGRGHLRLTGPQGVVYVPGTPSDRRTEVNLRAQLRRAGLIPR